MARHARAVDERPRRTRALAVAVVWIAGLAAGFYALLSAASRYTTCSASSTGLACRSGGTALGVFLVLAVVATVTAVTVVTHEREPRQVVPVAAAGLVALAVWYLLAQALLGTA